MACWVGRRVVVDARQCRAESQQGTRGRQALRLGLDRPGASPTTTTQPHTATEQRILRIGVSFRTFRVPRRFHRDPLGRPESIPWPSRREGPPIVADPPQPCQAAKRERSPRPFSSAIPARRLNGPRKRLCHRLRGGKRLRWPVKMEERTIGAGPIGPGTADRPDILRSQHDEDVRIFPHCREPGGRHRLDGGRRPGRRPNGRSPGTLLSGPYPVDWWSATARATSGRCATARTGTSAAPTSSPTSRRSPARSPAASAGSRSTCRSSPRRRSRVSSARRSRSPSSPGTGCRPGC